MDLPIIFFIKSRGVKFYYFTIHHYPFMDGTARELGILGLNKETNN